MTLLRDLRRLGALVLAPVALSAALLTACGGGTSQVVAFHPDRLVVFGDENSVIEDFVDATGKHDGYKYSINNRSSTTLTSGHCLLLPTFAQSLASQYGFAFQNCNPTDAAVKAVVRAEVGATTTGLAQQLAGVPGGLGPTDLASVMIGSNDIIALYERVAPGPSPMSRAEAVAEAQRLGAVAAARVNDILSTGARAIVITIPNMGLSPYAVNANKTDPGAAALLGDMSYEFNAYLRTRIDSSRYDGRNYGLVLADDIVAAMNKLPSSFLSSPYNVSDAACTSATVTACVIAADATQTTLVAGASSGSHLWADDRHLGPNAHSRIGAQAQSRAVNNPF